MRPSVSIAIPQPCPENWAAMMPTAAGRHCAACAHVVVDFTLKTAAEILAYLAGAAGGRTCGRFAAGQLERPLQRAVPAAPTARWRAWLAAAVAVWGLREGSSVTAQAQAPAEWRARYWGGPVPAAPQAETPEAPAAVAPLEVRKSIATAAPPFITQHFVVGGAVATTLVATCYRTAAAAPLQLRGVVTDSISGEGLPGVTVLLPGTQIGFSTGPTGAFALLVPAEQVLPWGVRVQVSSIGYVTQRRVVTTATAGSQPFRLQNDVKGLMGLVIIPPRKLPPAPWHPRRFYYWGKYWLRQSFRRR